MLKRRAERAEAENGKLRERNAENGKLRERNAENGKLRERNAADTTSAEKVRERGVGLEVRCS